MYGALDRIELITCRHESGAANMEAGKPALLKLRLDPEAISPNATLSQIRAQRK